MFSWEWEGEKLRPKVKLRVLKKETTERFLEVRKAQKH